MLCIALETRCEEKIHESKYPIEQQINVFSQVFLVFFAFPGCQTAFGHQNPLTLETAEQLADLLVASSDLISAWKLRRQLLEWYRSAYGEEGGC